MLPLADKFSGVAEGYLSADMIGQGGEGAERLFFGAGFNIDPHHRAVFRRIVRGIGEGDFQAFIQSHGEAPPFAKVLADKCGWLRVKNPRERLGIQRNSEVGRAGIKIMRGQINMFVFQGCHFKPRLS